VWESIRDDVLGTQPSPGEGSVLATALVALALVALPRAWQLSRHVVTIAHEGAHGVAALLSGRRLAGIRLHSDTSGLTLSAGRPSGPGMILTLLAGYVAPSLVGLAGAWLLAGNRITLLLWVAVALLLAMLVMIRNVFGVLSLLVTGGVVLAVSWYASPQVQAAFGWTSVWFLLLGGVRPVVELQRLRSRGRMPESDADQLARLTPFPALFWVTVFMLVSLTALGVGALLLAGQILTDAGLTL
jgi:hypothetical protein